MKDLRTIGSTILENLIFRSLRATTERDRLIGDDETFNKAFRYYRAAGSCICLTCGLEYLDHPVVRMKEKQHYGCELHVLCNTDRVKL